MRLPSFVRNLDLLSKRNLLYGAFPRHIRLLEFLNNNALLYEWTRAQHDVPQFADRSEYFAHLARTACPSPIDYLEFGVHKGASILEWSQLDTHPDSRFNGFDTFEGLPEDWEFAFGAMRKGTFDTGGSTPVTQDPRIRFHKGLFQSTLEPFLADWKPRGTVVIHIDSDLYSAALFVLTRLDPVIAKGAIVMFDDFYSPLHDFRAFRDYTSSYQRKAVTLAGAGGRFKSAAFRMSA